MAQLGAGARLSRTLEPYRAAVYLPDRLCMIDCEFDEPLKAVLLKSTLMMTLGLPKILRILLPGIVLSSVLVAAINKRISSTPPLVQ